MLNRWRKTSPKKQLKILSIAFLASEIAIFILVFYSLAITSSNLMISNELNTQSQSASLSQHYPLYYDSQKVIVGFDVLLILFIPLLGFSVFTFYTKGNLIIIIATAVIALVRLIFSFILIFANSELRQVWQNMWESTNEGTSPTCLLQSCGESIINYVVCGKLALWMQLRNYQKYFCAFFIILSIAQLILANYTNALDLKIGDNSQSSNASD